MKKELIKTITTDIVRYIVLFLIYIGIGTILDIVVDTIINESNVHALFAADLVTLSLMAFIAILTKPTPISVLLFGGFTYFLYGNGTSGYLFYMALFPIIYFVEKKGLYKSTKAMIHVTLICIGLLIMDFFYARMLHQVSGYEVLYLIISVLIAFFYAIHKPKLIKKFFPISVERKESKKRALSTRIIMLFVIIALLIFVTDWYSFDIFQNQKSNNQNASFWHRVSDDMDTLIAENNFTNETAQKALDLVGKWYDGIICYDVNGEVFIEAYQDWVPASLDRTIFTAQINNVLKNAAYKYETESIRHENFYYSLCCYELYNEPLDELNPEYYIFMVKENGGALTGNITGFSSSFSRFYVMICMLLPAFFWLIELIITRPINSMTALVSKYVYSNDEHRNELEKQFQQLQIHTGDEIENLYHAFGKTILDMNAYIDDLHSKSEKISQMQFSMITTLANVVENRDKSTGSHIKRTAEYVEIIAKQMCKNEKYKDILTPKYIEDIKIAAPLHDMGKIHVSDTILNKPGKLDDNEYSIMKSHSIEGKKILQQTIKDFGEFDYLLLAVEMAGSHHERYDGRGYPEGLSGEDIPLCARIMAVADVFDALVSKRSYKEPMPLSKAYSIIKEGKGTQFDPDAVDAFFEAIEQIEESYNTLD